jgi:23S rRNA pseudouridine2605 synthase
VEERLQKIMAKAGLGSRRACETLISAGRVTVNGKLAELGMKADLQRDQIIVDGQALKLPEALVYIAINKPRGVLSAVSDPDKRSTVRDLIDLPGNFYPVGRLDLDSEGLMLLTNDGDLANKLTHPRYEHEKEYRVLVARKPDDEQLNTWRRGVVLPDGHRTLPAEVKIDKPFGKGMWLRVTLKEGRKRQIRETGTMLGLPVAKIIRIRFGSLYLGNLKLREWRYLTPDEIKTLKEGKKNQPPPKRSHFPRKPASNQRSASGKGRSSNKSPRSSTQQTQTRQNSVQKTIPKSRRPGRS